MKYKRLIIPCFNSNELNANDNRCKPIEQKDVMCVEYIPTLDLYTLSIYYIDNKSINNERGSIISSLTSSDIYNPNVTFDEFIEKNGDKYDSIDKIRFLYKSYDSNQALQKMLKDTGYRRRLSLSKLDVI